MPSMLTKACMKETSEKLDRLRTLGRRPESATLAGQSSNVCSSWQATAAFLPLP
jgi:hypothetical protein